MNSQRLDYWTKKKLIEWLEDYPQLKEVYLAKEALFKIYRCRGKKRARRSLINLTDWLAGTKLKELKSLRKTLLDWQNEILNYFGTRLTNARTEGYNNVCNRSR